MLKSVYLPIAGENPVVLNNKVLEYEQLEIVKKKGKSKVLVKIGSGKHQFAVAG